MLIIYYLVAFISCNAQQFRGIFPFTNQVLIQGDIYMKVTFADVDRETLYLLPPSIQEWLPEKHLARFVVEIVEQINLQPIKASYSGRGS